MSAFELSPGTFISDGKVRQHVLSLYAEAARDWHTAGRRLARAFRRARTLHSRERRFVGEAVHGLIRGRRRWAFAVSGRDAAAAFDADPLPLYLAWLAHQEHVSATTEWLDACRAAKIDRARLLPEAVDAQIAGQADPIARLGLSASLPDFIAAILIDAVGSDTAQGLAQAFNARAPLTVRANRLKVDARRLQERLTKEGVTARPTQLGVTLPDALDLDGHVNANGLRAFADGCFEVQDAASQAVVALLGPPGAVVVDVCAGAGGKTLALGAAMGNRGRLWALDIADLKLEELRERARRAGLTNVQTHRVSAELEGPLDAALSKLVGRADSVLIDAPCSGIGALRRHPETRWRLLPGEQVALPTLQRQILERYAPLARVGGRLVYATCTVARNENDAVVDAFLVDHPEFVAVPARSLLGDERAIAWGDGERLRLYPHLHGSDGFFAAALTRRS